MADIEINKSDIDEVNDVIQETDEEAYSLDSEFTEEKEYKTVQKYELVTILSYLIGVRNEILDYMCSDEYVELLNSLRENKNARILRYLCKARTSLLRNYKKTDNEIKYNLGNINRMEWFDAENINKLESWEVHIILYNSSADKYCVHINKLINEHVDACKKLFPDWVKWEYIRDLFVIADYEKPKKLKAEFTVYKEHRKEYPYGMYIHWRPDGRGNLLNSDGRILKTIYRQHGDYFNDGSKYRDAVEDTKENIYEFIRESMRVVIVVDCENSDVYKLYGVLKNLNSEQMSKIEKSYTFMMIIIHPVDGTGWKNSYISLYSTRRWNV